jgi:uncharacterized protein
VGLVNRLASAQSPYLSQHQNNPVDWFEWGEEAFSEARTRDLPILLSIGYAACHWCHVMAHESFEDVEIARFMNERFVNIKVDREERPDIDAIYMAATQAITGHGGWPMTVFLDHELKPFYAGTYFPPTPRHGLPSFQEVLEAMSDAWLNQKELIAKSTGEIVEQLQAQNSKLNQQELQHDRVLDSAIANLRQEFDLEHAGFGGAPKFPPHTTLKFLLRYLTQSPNPEVMGWVERTAIAMASGGMYDQLGGGFARYSVDNRWLVPHFEKMLYDNAVLIEVYAELHLRTKNPRYKKILEDSVHFVLRELRTPEGVFASSLDADSEGEEGKYYAFDLADLEAALGERSVAAAKLFKVSDKPSFEAGKSVLQYDLEHELPGAEYLELQKTLLAYRERRVRPERDDKVLTGWNAWMISALLRAATTLDDDQVAEAAKKALDYLLEKHFAGTDLVRSSLGGTLSKVPGQLEDWASLGVALIKAHGFFGDRNYFLKAEAIAQEITTRFKSEIFYDTELRHTQTPVRPRTLTDSGSPSPHGIAAEFYRELHLITGNSEYLSQAQEILSELSALMARAPRATSSALYAFVGLNGQVSEYAVVGSNSELHHHIQALPDDGSVISAGEPGDTPLLQAREYVEGKPTVYVCKSFSCKLPVTDLEALKKQLEPNS